VFSKEDDEKDGGKKEKEAEKILDQGWCGVVATMQSTSCITSQTSIAP